MGKKNIKTAECTHHSAVIATSHSLQVKPKPGSPRTSSCLHAHFGSEWFPFGWPLNSDNLMIHSVANVRSSPCSFSSKKAVEGHYPEIYLSRTPTNAICTDREHMISVLPAQRSLAARTLSCYRCHRWRKAGNLKGTFGGTWPGMRTGMNRYQYVWCTGRPV